MGCHVLGLVWAILGPSWRPLVQSGKRLGRSWGSLGGPSGRLWAIFRPMRPSWADGSPKGDDAKIFKTYGTSTMLVSPSSPGGLLEPCWAASGASWAVLRLSWAVLEASWAVLEASWGVLAALVTCRGNDLGICVSISVSIGLAFDLSISLPISVVPFFVFRSQ